MKRIVVLLVGAVLVMVLAACGSESVHEAYVASGDGTTPDALVKTTTFLADDDLNVVVTLGAHSRTLPVYAVFTAPSGVSYATDTLEADNTVGRCCWGWTGNRKGPGAGRPGRGRWTSTSTTPKPRRWNSPSAPQKPSRDVFLFTEFDVHWLLSGS